MKMITLFLPEKWLEMIDEVIADGYTPNRSEFIRHCISSAMENSVFIDKYKKSLDNQKREKIERIIKEGE